MIKISEYQSPCAGHVSGRGPLQKAARAIANALKSARLIQSPHTHHHAPATRRLHCAMMASLLLLCTLAIPAATADADRASQANTTQKADSDGVRLQWLAAYLEMEKAERLATAGNQSAALASFQRALLAFRNISAQYPDWNARMLAYRIAYCRGRCQELELGDHTELSQMQPEELRRRLAYERDRNTSLVAENASLRLTLSKSSAQDGGDAAEMDRLAAENASLKASLESARAAFHKSELRETAWRQAAAGAEKARQALTDALLERDEALATLKERELDVADLQAKLKSLLQQLKNADKSAKTPQNYATNIQKEELEQLKQALATKEAELNAFREREKHETQRKNELRSLLSLAANKERDGDDASAARFWATIADIEPADAMSALRAAVWYARVGMRNEADKWSGRFFARSFQDPEPLSALAAEMMAIGELNRALALAAWAAALKPGDPQAGYVLASVYVAGGFLNAAEAQYRQVIASTPQHNPSLLALATILASAQPPRIKEAKELYIRALKAGAKPDNVLENVLK